MQPELRRSKNKETIKETDWITYFSDKNVLPSYAFPIYNVRLDTVDEDLRLDRDLKIALSEYAPGASIVAKGKLWQSVGIKKPVNKALKQQCYARCPECWHVQRRLQRDELFAENSGACPVCGNQIKEIEKHNYIVPEHGFTTNMQEGGKELVFNRPEKIVASRVLFVPQQESEQIADMILGDNSNFSVSLRGSEDAQFFVFNNGEDGRGFYLCTSCGIKGDPPKTEFELTECIVPYVSNDQQVFSGAPIPPIERVFGIS